VTWEDNAKELRACGKTYEAIAAECGKGLMQTWRVLNPPKKKPAPRILPHTPEWYMANEARAQIALTDASIWYGPEQYRPPPWKTAPDHTWLDLLLADVEEFERKMARNDGGDVCIK
jgi:hypothetical protein